jgi:hypothetical protein
MADDSTARPTWKKLLARGAPLVLPAAHDALTTRLIERAGFPTYQVGGFAATGARHGFPDIDLTRFGEEYAAVRDIIAACPLPVLVDADDGYGDAKNVTRTVRAYEALGASTIFIEDQKAPKRCGHMAGKTVVPPEEMESKVRAAAARTRSYWPAPTPSPRTGSTTPCAGPSATSPAALTAFMLKARAPSGSWSASAGRFGECRWRPTSWRASARLPGCRRVSCAHWASRCCSTRRRCCSA